MSEIQDRQDAASAIDPIVAAHGDGATSDSQAVAAVEGFDEAAEPADAEAGPPETQKPPAAEAEALQPDGRADGASDAVAASDIADAIEAELLSEAPQSEDASAFEHMPAGYADTIVELDPVVADDDAPLLDGDLEDGIASVFAALHAAREDAAAPEPSDDLETAEVVTFRLLGELDRLWHRAA